MTTAMANAIPLEVPVEDLTTETAAEALELMAEATDFLAQLQRSNEENSL